MKHILPISMLVILTVIPAFADNITNESMCVVDTLGQSLPESTAGIEAMWTADTINCRPGYYLNKTTAECTACPIGSFCPGGDFTVEMQNTGNNLCSSLGDGTYTATSTTNSILNFSCFKSGTLACSTVNPYSGLNSNKVTSVTYGNATNGSATCKTFYGTTGCFLDTENACNITDITCDTGYHKASVSTELDEADKLKLQYLAPNAQTIMQAWRVFDSVAAWRAIDNTPCTSPDFECTYSYSSKSPIGLNNGEIALLNDNMLFFGESFCSSNTGTSYGDTSNGVDEYEHYVYNNDAISDSDFNRNSTGDNCWCRSKFAVDTTTMQPIAAYSKWLYTGNYTNPDVSCSSHCASACRMYFSLYDGSFNNVIRANLETNGKTSLQCVANTINLEWYADSTSQTPLTVDTASQTCTYDQRITVPATTPTKPGYTFAGWVLRQ